MHVRKIVMLRYKSTGAARCSAMAVRAIRARMPAANTRPPREQKIHAGKKEPKMLYSGGWEQPTNASGATSDNPASGGSEVVRRRSHALDSVFKSGRPHAHRSFVLTTSSIRTERTSRAIRPPLDTLGPVFRLGHRVTNRIHWTKVSINTFVSGDDIEDRSGPCP
jgi:hypothetical protein